MAEIDLRSYEREIQDLLDRGEIIGIAHCRHILTIYPKRLVVYRLLGQFLLENQLPEEAGDVFSRLLSSAPDDLAANLGQALICEEQDRLDEALWHMQIAFDLKPADPAIQDEFRRLLGRRDGVEPTHIELTRGALARMYARGGLYTQAVGELRCILADHPQRLDLQALLAEVLFQDGQETAAAAVCANLQRKLPDCLAANRILACILAKSGQEKEKEPYYRRWVAMDPYAAFITDMYSSGDLTPASDLVPTSNLVPDQAIMVERLNLI